MNFHAGNYYKHKQSGVTYKCTEAVMNAVILNGYSEDGIPFGNEAHAVLKGKEDEYEEFEFVPKVNINKKIYGLTMNFVIELVTNYGLLENGGDISDFHMMDEKFDFSRKLVFDDDIGADKKYKTFTDWEKEHERRIGHDDDALEHRDYYMDVLAFFFLVKKFVGKIQKESK